MTEGSLSNRYGKAQNYSKQVSPKTFKAVDWWELVQYHSKMENWVSKDSLISQWTQTWGCVKSQLKRLLSGKRMKLPFIFGSLLPPMMKMLTVKGWSPLVGCCLLSCRHSVSAWLLIFTSLVRWIILHHCCLRDEHTSHHLLPACMARDWAPLLGERADIWDRPQSERGWSPNLEISFLQ